MIVVSCRWDPCALHHTRAAACGCVQAWKCGGAAAACGCALSLHCVRRNCSLSHFDAVKTHIVWCCQTRWNYIVEMCCCLSSNEFPPFKNPLHVAVSEHKVSAEGEIVVFPSWCTRAPLTLNTDNTVHSFQMLANSGSEGSDITLWWLFLHSNC